QSCCANDQNAMAQFWMHNGFLQINGEKMSKSEGNFYTVDELLHSEKFGGRKWPGDVLRVAMLMKSYREPIDFSLAKLEEAERILQRWKKSMGALGLVFDAEHRAEIETFEPCSKVIAALANDMNMAGVLAELHRHAKGDKLHNAKRLFGSLKLLGVVTFESMAAWQSATQKLQENSAFDVARIEEKIALRLAALSEKNWTEADRIRDQLASEGIELTDSKDSTTGQRLTTWESGK
ncbi:MAG: cysteine--tRNA ligase, partial [Rhizobiaceae bacterium]|nr:cysteine--tRNA ligase [Rhizobiaceae bacterium]